MANPVELAVAYISILPSIVGLEAKMSAALDPAQAQAKAAGVKAGEGFSQAFSSSMTAASGAVDKLNAATKPLMTSMTALSDKAKMAGTGVSSSMTAAAASVDKLNASTKPLTSSLASVEGSAKAMSTSVTSAGAASSTSMTELTARIKAMSTELGSSTTPGITALDRLAAAAQVAGQQATAAMDRYNLEIAKQADATLPAIAGLDKFGAAATLAAAKAEDALSAYAAAAATAGAEAGAGLARGVETGTAEATASMEKSTEMVKELAGGLLAGFAIGGAIEFFKDAAKAATEDALAVRMVKGEYGDASESVLKFSENAANAYGMSASAANMAAAKMGQFLGAMGITGETAANLSTKVIGLSADIGKFVNADPASVEAAIQGALKGRGAAMAQFGVHISTATVLQEAMTEGLITQGKTLTDTQRATATLGLIMKDTANEQGAFAKSSGEIGTSQTILKANLENLAATAGNAVMPVLASLSSIAVNVLVPAVKAVFTVIQPLLNTFTNLPGPVKDVAAAFGIFLLLRGPLSSVFSTISLGVRNFTNDVSNIKAAAAESGDSISTLGAVAERSSGMLASLGKMVGTAGVFAAATYIISSFADSEAHAKAIQDDLSNSVQTLSAALVQNGGKWDDVAKSALTASVTGSSNFQELLSRGVNYGDLMDLVTGKSTNAAKALNEINFNGASADDQAGLISYVVKLGSIEPAAKSAAAQVREYNAAQEAAAKLAGPATVVTSGAATALAGLSENYRNTSDQAKNYVKDLTTLGKGQDEAKSGAVALAKSFDAINKQPLAVQMKIYGESLTSVAGKAGLTAAQVSSAHDRITELGASMLAAAKTSDLSAMADSIKTVSDAATAASAAVQGLSINIDVLDGRDVPLEDANKNLNAQIVAMATAFKDAATATKDHTDSLISDKGVIDTTTTAGQKLYDSVTSYKNAYDVSVVAAEKAAGAHATVAQQVDAARKAADGARQAFIDQAMTVNGMTLPAAIALADHMGILQGIQLTPKVLNLSAQDKATSVINAMETQLQSLKDKTVTLTVAQVIAGSQAQINLNNATATARGNASGGFQVGPGTGTSDSILSRLSNGEFVVKASATAKHRALLEAINNAPGYANGGLVVNIGSTGNAASGEASKLSALWGAVDSQVATKNAATAKSVAAAAAAMASKTPAATAGGVEQWRPMVTAALAAKGVPLQYVQTELNQMAQESSGNAAAINLTDSNAQAGHPSEGLLQFIQGTFNAYADPGYNTNIWDPMSQMRAFVNYINADYGGMAAFTARQSANGWGPYADGGWVSGPGTGTSDSITARLSNGEFVVKASAAAQHAALLTSINGGNGNGGPGFATGGPVNVNALAGIAPSSPTDRLQRVIQGISDLGIIVSTAQTTAAADRAKATAAVAALQTAEKAASASVALSSRKLSSIQLSADYAVSSAQSRVNAAQQSVDSATKATQRATAQARLDAAQKQLAYVQQTQQQRVASAQVSAGNAGVRLAAQQKMTKAALATASAADKAAASSAKLVASQTAQDNRLRSLAARYDATTIALTNAQANLASLTSQRTSDAASITSSGIGFDGGLTGHSAQRGTFDSILNGQNYDLNQVAGIDKMAQALKAKGLTGSSIQSAVNAALGGDSTTLTALSGASAAQIKQLNSVTGQIQAWSANLGSNVAGAMDDAGAKAAQGLVSGLTSQQSAINAAMVRIADGMAKAMKHALGIKSPSKKFHDEVGIPIAAGVISGMASQSGAVARASAGLVKVPTVARIGGSTGSPITADSMRQAVSDALEGATFKLDFSRQQLAVAVAVGNRERGLR